MGYGGVGGRWSCNGGNLWRDLEVWACGGTGRVGEVRGEGGGDVRERGGEREKEGEAGGGGGFGAV